MILDWWYYLLYSRVTCSDARMEYFSWSTEPASGCKYKCTMNYAHLDGSGKLGSAHLFFIFIVVLLLEFLLTIATGLAMLASSQSNEFSAHATVSI